MVNELVALGVCLFTKLVLLQCEVPTAGHMDSICVKDKPTCLSLVYTVPVFSPGGATMWTPGPTGTTP